MLENKILSDKMPQMNNRNKMSLSFLPFFSKIKKKWIGFVHNFGNVMVVQLTTLIMWTGSVLHAYPQDHVDSNIADPYVPIGHAIMLKSNIVSSWSSYITIKCTFSCYNKRFLRLNFVLAYLEEHHSLHYFWGKPNWIQCSQWALSAC